MNVTQRKFAIRRAYEVLVNKLNILKQEDTARNKEFEEAHTISLQDALDAIYSGEVQLWNKAGLVDKGIDSSLSGLYDFSKLQREVSKSNKGMEKPLKYEKKEEVLLHIPDTDSWNAAKMSATFLSNHKRAKKIAAAFKAVCDEIMLGDNSEALKSIREIESRTF